MKKITMFDKTKKTIKITTISMGAIATAGVGLYFLNKSRIGENVKQRIAKELVRSMIEENKVQFVAIVGHHKSVPRELKDEFNAFITAWMEKLP